MKNLKNRKIAFLGLGNMGEPMVANLAAAGFKLSVYDISPEVVERVAAITDVAPVVNRAGLAGAEILILMLPNGDIVRDILLGKDGIANNLAEGAIIIDMSSSTPTGTEELSQDLANRGIRMVDAPVSGGVPRAQSGTLAIMAGGDADLINELQPLFDALSSSMVHVGKIGSGHAMKALNNYVSAAGLVAACEALRIGEAFGIPGNRVIEVLNSSTGCNNSTKNKLGQYILPESYNSGFSLSLMRKDLQAAMDLADHLKMQLVLGHEVLRIWEVGDKKLGPGADHTAIDQLLSQDS